MSRFVLGPQVQGAKLRRNPSMPVPAPPVDEPAPVVKGDVAVDYASHDAFGNVAYNLPAYDLATHNRLVGLHTVFVPSGESLPADGPSAMHSGYAVGSLDVSGQQGGGTFTVPAPSIADGEYVIQTVLEFES